MTARRLQAEGQVPLPLLQQFSAVVLQDSSTITLPDELAEQWRGCGGSHGASNAALKLFVRSYVLNGRLQGPSLTQGRHSDGRSPRERGGFA